MDILARWREAGRWWEGEPPLEVIQYRDAKGIKREKTRELPPFHTPLSCRVDAVDHREDYILRPRKTRDEKVAIACGLIKSSGTIPIHRARESYVPLHVYSGYSFGKSTLFARELPRRAADLGLPAMALTDWMSLAGVMEFAHEARNVGITPLIGATVEMEEGGHLVIIAQTSNGYRAISRLITQCHLSQPRLFPLCSWDFLEAFAEDWLILTGGDGGWINLPLVRRDHAIPEERLLRLISLVGRERLLISIERSAVPWEIMVNEGLLELATRHHLRCVAASAITHAHRDNFPSQDILVCAETLCTVEELIGRKPQRHPSQPAVATRPQRAFNGERFLRSPDEFNRLYADHPELIDNTHLVTEMVESWVLPPRAELPWLTDDPAEALRFAVQRGAEERHKKMNHRLKMRLGHEVDRIINLGFAHHFLVAWELCEWAKREGILLSGRGSVVDSAVAYCLGMSRIDAFAHGLHFDRFLPADGSKRPDIDIDFEAARRDDVRNHLIKRFGADHVANVGAFGAYCSRGIIRAVGKAMGLDQAALGFLAKRVHMGVAPDQIASALEKRPELRQSGISTARLEWIFRLAGQLMDVPINLRAHSSGVVVCDRPVYDFVPITWSAGMQEDNDSSGHLRMMQWDKRSAKYCFDKFDLLCLRGQDALSGTQRRIRESNPIFHVEDVPIDDPETYRTMRSGHLVGIPQSASPAMRQAHMRIKTQDLADASLVQAGIRPGVGGAVKMNELIARRHGHKPYAFEHPDLEPILGHTYGIVVFQEQIDQLLQVFAGYSGGEAEDIRDAIHKRRKEDYGKTIREELMERIQSRGYTPEVCEHVFDLIANFKGYGFAQGHALAFAEISVRSIFCQQNFPAEYFASLLDCQPAGYYGPCTLANEARNRGVMMLPPCVNKGSLRFEVEAVKSREDPQIIVPQGGIRVSLKQISGVSRGVFERIVEGRGEGYRSFFDFVKRVRPAKDELERLILSGALDDLYPHRRAMLWAIPEAVRFAEANSGSLGVEIPEPVLNHEVVDFSPAEKHIRERQVLGLDVAQHLMAYERERAREKGVLTTAEAQNLKDQEWAYVVGNPIRLRFPPTPSGKRVVFFDLEDETGLLNVTCFDRTYQQDGGNIICASYVTVYGQAQWREGHMAFLAKRVHRYHPVITKLANQEVSELPVVASDFLVG